MARQYAPDAGPRFSWSYLRAVRLAAIGGMLSTAEIAQALRRTDPRITTAHVTRWRFQHPLFEQACNDALDRANTEIANVVFEAAKGGDVAAARYWLDRRSPAFMPKQKNVNEAGEQLADILSRRAVPPEELVASGVLVHRPRPPLDDGDGYDD